MLMLGTHCLYLIYAPERRQRQRHASQRRRRPASAARVYTRYYTRSRGSKTVKPSEAEAVKLPFSPCATGRRKNPGGEWLLLLEAFRSARSWYRADDFSRNGPPGGAEDARLLNNIPTRVRGAIQTTSSNRSIVFIGDTRLASAGDSVTRSR